MWCVTKCKKISATGPWSRQRTERRNVFRSRKTINGDKRRWKPGIIRRRRWISSLNISKHSWLLNCPCSYEWEWKLRWECCRLESTLVKFARTIKFWKLKISLCHRFVLVRIRAVGKRLLKPEVVRARNANLSCCDNCKCGTNHERPAKAKRMWLLWIPPPGTTSKCWKRNQGKQ